MIFLSWTEWDFPDPRDRLERSIVQSFTDDCDVYSERTELTDEDGRSGQVLVAGFGTVDGTSVAAGIQTRGIGSLPSGDVTQQRLSSNRSDQLITAGPQLAPRGPRSRTLFAVGSTPNGTVGLASIERYWYPRDEPGIVWLSGRYVSGDSSTDGQTSIRPRIIAQLPSDARYPDGAIGWSSGDMVGCADNTVVTAWADDRDDNGFFEIRAVGHDAPTNDGILRLNPPKFELTVNAEASGQQVGVTLAAVGGSSFVAIWMDDADRNGYWQLKGRIITTEGIPGDQFTVNRDEVGNQVSPAAAPLEDGGFVVAWLDDEREDWKNRYWVLMCERFDPEGTRVGQPIEVTRGYISRPVIGGLPDGGFIIAYSADRRVLGSYETLTLHHFDASGIELREVEVTSSGGSEINPADPLHPRPLPQTTITAVRLATSLGSSSGTPIVDLSPS